jgi:hypothetical protein
LPAAELTGCQVIFHNGHSNDAIQGLQTVKSKYGVEAILPYPVDASNPSLPPGPYFWSPASGIINAAYRLYSDEQGAFTQGLIPSGNGAYDVIPAAVPVWPSTPIEKTLAHSNCVSGSWVDDHWGTVKAVFHEGPGEATSRCKCIVPISSMLSKRSTYCMFAE